MDKLINKDVMIKVALNLKQMRAATGALKNKVIRAGYDKSWFGGGLSKKNIGISAASPEYIKSDVGKRMISMLGDTDSKVPFFYRLNQKQIFSGKGGLIGMEKDLKDMSGVSLKTKRLNSNNKEAFNRMALMHEGLELKTKAKDYLPISSHSNPSVLLREHNMIQSLPKRLVGAGNVFKRMRAQTGESGAMNMLSNNNFNYGESPRLSRHAIKRMANVIVNTQKKMSQNLQELIPQ